MASRLPIKWKSCFLSQVLTISLHSVPNEPTLRSSARQQRHKSLCRLLPLGAVLVELGPLARAGASKGFWREWCRCKSRRTRKAAEVVYHVTQCHHSGRLQMSCTLSSFDYWRSFSASWRKRKSQCRNRSLCFPYPFPLSNSIRSCARSYKLTLFPLPLGFFLLRPLSLLSPWISLSLSRSLKLTNASIGSRRARPTLFSFRGCPSQVGRCIPSCDSCYYRPCQSPSST